MKRSRKAYCFYAYEMKIDDEEGEFVGKWSWAVKVHCFGVYLMINSECGEIWKEAMVNMKATSHCCSGGIGENEEIWNRFWDL
jgi:hypothetical protein